MTLSEALQSINIHPIFPTPYEEYKSLSGMEHIYPTKQRMVYNIYMMLMEKAGKTFPKIDRFYIFGSSTSIYVDRHSDLDIAIALHIDHWDEESSYLNDLAKLISKETKGNFDLVFLNDPDIYSNARLMKEITQNGVLICAK